ncbi:phage holin family protein [Kutzneria sp. NPDC051319]|uniref:phage holin family protein n=1 Tax=Kutzneria sp. NPDC051319 TaxID=3155047 RepID=UPI00341CC8FA
MPQDEASTGQLLGRLTEQLSTLVRDEAALAVVEVKTKARAAGIGVGVLVGAALFGFLGLCALIACAIIALALVLPAWLSALAVGGALIVFAGLLGAFAVAKLRRGVPPVPQETVANVKDDAAIIRRAVTQ